MQKEQKINRWFPDRARLLAWGWLLPLLPGWPMGYWVLPSPAARFHWVGWSWLMLVLALLLLLNQWLHQWLQRRLPWQDAPQRRFFIQLLSSLSLSLLLMNLSFWLFHRLLLQNTPEPDQFQVLNGYGLIFLVPLVSAQVVSYLFALWKKSTLLTERLEQENIQNKLESLKSHLDPHFLFNSLNILSSLIDKSPKDAQEFLASFSDVYRYVLHNKEASLVPLRSEWTFLEAYLHLIRVRFRGQIHIELQPPEAIHTWVIPPLALQLLVENAIKHNKASDRQPLRLSIRAEGDYLLVENNRRPQSRNSAGPGIGLANLRSRYGYLTHKPLVIEASEDIFLVRLPLIERKEA